MKKIGLILIRGIDAILPLGVTLYVIYWLAFYGDKWLVEIFRPMMPESYIWPGTGVVAGLLAMFVIGLFAITKLGGWVFASFEKLCNRVPLVKTVFRGTQDFTRFFFATSERGDFGQVVWVPFGNMHLIGFVTRGPAYGPADTAEADRTVAVYVSMSAGIGGFTVYIPRSKLEPTGLTVEEGMRLVLSAGVSMAEPPRAVPPPKPEPEPVPEAAPKAKVEQAPESGVPGA
jgi:uncharacterized membrane protein